MVFDETKLKKTAQRAKKAFANYPTKWLWSTKTCYLTAICKLYFTMGWGAEVVSEFEMDKMLWAGIAGKDITLNGPCWSKDALLKALKLGSTIHLDSLDELTTVERLVAEHDLHGTVGVRCWMKNPHLDGPAWSKFGLALDTGEAARAALRVIHNPRLTLDVLHNHCGTQVREPQAYAYTARKLVKLRTKLYEQTDYLIPSLNLGGGFPSAALLHSEPDGTKRPAIEEYAKAITSVLNKLPLKERPRLALEAGRHLIDEAGSLVTSVAAVKNGMCIVDTGVHQLYTSQFHRLDVLPTWQCSAAEAQTTRLSGNLCMSIDVVRDEVLLPPLEPGSLLVIRPAGAYNITQSMQFISLRPAVVLVEQSGAVRLIRRRELLADVQGLESSDAC
jgi:diaminopimelate decarboxylase